MTNPNENELIAADKLDECGRHEEAADLRLNPFVIGANYLLRTATVYWVATIRSVGPHEIVVGPACYVYETGRYMEALRDGLEAQEVSEIEPIEGLVLIARGGLIDAAPYPHEIPTEMK